MKNVRSHLVKYAVVIGTVSMAVLAAPAVATAAAGMPAVAQQGATDGQWREYGADAGSTKYSSLDQITRDNVRDLRIVWSRPAVDASTVEQSLVDPAIA